MGESILGIDKGMIKAFALMILVIGSLTTFFMSEYVSMLVLGSVSYAAINGTTYAQTRVTGESFTVYNATHAETSLANPDIVVGTIAVYNDTSGVIIGLNNFSIGYLTGTINTTNAEYNATTFATNYTYATQSGGHIPVSSDAGTLLGTVESDYITTFGYVNTGIKFAAALITVVAVILIFASFLPKKGKRERPIDY